jgi:hypothetical protein
VFNRPSEAIRIETMLAVLHKLGRSFQCYRKGLA